MFTTYSIHKKWTETSRCIAPTLFLVHFWPRLDSHAFGKKIVFHEIKSNGQNKNLFGGKNTNHSRNNVPLFLRVYIFHKYICKSKPFSSESFHVHSGWNLPFLQGLSNGPRRPRFLRFGKRCRDCQRRLLLLLSHGCDVAIALARNDVIDAMQFSTSTSLATCIHFQMYT